MRNESGSRMCVALIQICQQTLKEQDAFLRVRFGVSLAEAQRQSAERKAEYQKAWETREEESAQ